MQPKLKNQTSDLSLDGLEGLLDSKPEDASETPGTTASGDTNSQDWTLEETARALGLSRGAIIRRLEDGILSGYKLKRSYGWVWRVRPSWLAKDNTTTSSASAPDPEGFDASPAQFSVSSRLVDEGTATSEDRKDDQFVEVFDVCEESAGLPGFPQPSFRELIELKTKLQMTEFQYQDAHKKLESANYKIGYLEARLDVQKEQQKLIGETKAKRSWLNGFRKWFLSGS